MMPAKDTLKKKTEAAAKGLEEKVGKLSAKDALKQLAADDALSAGAKAILARVDEPGDPPSEVMDEMVIDYDFQKWDPTDTEPYLVENGLKRNPELAYFWAETDKRVWPKYKAQGWRPLQGKKGSIYRGSTVLCVMSAKRRQAIIDHGEQKTRSLLNASMKRFDGEAAKYGDQGIEAFDGSRSPRDGL